MSKERQSDLANENSTWRGVGQTLFSRFMSWKQVTLKWILNEIHFICGRQTVYSYGHVRGRPLFWNLSHLLKMICQYTVINLLKTIKYMMVCTMEIIFFPLKYIRFFSTEKCYEGRIGKESRSYVSINWPLIWGTCSVENGARFGIGLWRGPS